MRRNRRTGYRTPHDGEIWAGLLRTGQIDGSCDIRYCSLSGLHRHAITGWHHTVQWGVCVFPPHHPRSMPLAVPGTPASARHPFFRRIRALVTASLLGAASVQAQELVRSAQPWKSLRTEWFDMHFPAESEAWAMELAPRLDAIHDAVQGLVGWAPGRRTTIVIDDPYNVANGSAIPLLDTPVINLWPTPPGPRDVIANHRGWATKLFAHEFGHIAHLARPARRSQWFWHLSPAQVSPITVGTPRWAIEGYATWIEGKVTGSGRPHAASRSAILRELALGGRLPSYGAMSSGGGYKGGNMAYLAGSAFWDWLAAQRGDTSMTLVFRRQTAAIRRGFDEAFRGVYGDAPATLYSRFAAELTVRAFAVDSALRSAGLVTGTRLARYAGAVGGPAVSANGQRMALVLPGVGGPPRIIVTKPDTQVVTARQRAAAERALARDPQDVAPIRIVPQLLPPIATLRPRRGYSYASPRFIDDSGTRVLVRTTDVRPDGSQRPELAIWETATGRVRHVTHDAAVSDADPSPDGTRAVAVQCIGGVCSLVIVSLQDGTVRTLTSGAPTRIYAQPRWSRDGRRIVANVQNADGQWHLTLVDPVSGATTTVTPDDDVNRHSASFEAGDTSLVYVSEQDGIPNLESLRLSDRVRTPRTRVSGSAWSPAALPDGSVLYLHEYSNGMELYRLPPNAVVAPASVPLYDTRLTPALPPQREPGMPLSARAVPPATNYGAHTRRYRWLAHGSMGRDGFVHAATIASTDPANRLSWLLTGIGGTSAAWRGGTAAVGWFGTRPNLRGEALWLEQRATRQWDAGRLAVLDLRVAGASLGVELPIAGNTVAQRLQLGVFGGVAQADTLQHATRATVSAAYAATTALGWRQSAGVMVRGTGGRLGDSSFARVSMGLHATAFGVRSEARMHRASAGTPRLEQFAAGGFAPPTSDEGTLSQRIALPAMPVGIAAGRAVYELRLARPMFLLPGTLYAHSVGTDWRPDRHSVILGTEYGMSVEHLGAIGLPRVRVLGGVAAILRGPLEHRATAYLSLGWRP